MILLNKKGCDAIKSLPPFGALAPPAPSERWGGAPPPPKGGGARVAASGGGGPIGNASYIEIPEERSDLSLNLSLFGFFFS
jgi:hypothetical protein